LARALATAAVAAAVLSAPAAAATVDPATLVLRQSDVPSGVRLVDGGIRTNADRTRFWPAGPRPPLARFGRLTGYDAIFARARPHATIVSSADVFRRAEGLDAYIAWWYGNTKNPPKRTPVWIGVRAWLVTDTVRSGSSVMRYTTVGWRHGRVAANLVATGLRRAAVLRLARLQQRRIAAALG
jgi:hypothetical protein